MLVTIVIPTYRDWDRLVECVRSLEQQTYPHDKVEILIINNDSESHPPSSFLLPKNGRMLFEMARGSYAARNLGIKMARGELIGFTDSDCILDPNWIANAVRVAKMQRTTDFRIAGPVHIFREQGGSWLAWKYDLVTAFNQKSNVKVGVSVTANLFVSNAAFRKVGLFDASLYSGGDVAWNKKATALGVMLVYAADIIAKHPARKSVRDLIRKARRVVGGGYAQAKEGGYLIRYTLRHLVPPFKLLGELLNERHKVMDVSVALSTFWLIKILMVVEILRLSLGGKPLR